MRGMGKSSVVREVFKKVLPPTWRNIWVTLTEGASYPRLLADIAYKCGIRVPLNFGTEATNVTVARDILTYLAGKPRVVLVIDDLQNALEASGEFSDLAVVAFLSDVIGKIAQNRNKIILITTNVPRLPPLVQESTETKYLTGLEREDAENLISFWYQFEREDLHGQVVDFPDSLFKVTAVNFFIQFLSAYDVITVIPDFLDMPDFHGAYLRPLFDAEWRLPGPPMSGH
jgi:hypothetical protein